jgi:hypothetical protein
VHVTCQDDDDTVPETVKVSLSLSTNSVKRGNKRKWALLFAFLGVAGAGAYAAFLSGDKKKNNVKKRSIHTQSLQSFGGSGKFNSRKPGMHLYIAMLLYSSLL